MRAIIYWLRVFFVSLEALVLLLAFMIWFVFRPQLEAVASMIALNDEFLKYVFVAPVTIGLWVANESRLLLQEDKSTIKILTKWPEYHLLKTHIWVSLLYALVFSVVSLVPWAAKAGVTSGMSFLLLVVAIVGQIVVAASIFAARIKVKEIIVHMDAA